MTSVACQLEEMLRTGRQMLAVAEDGDWARAGELQADCHARAERLFANPVSASDVEAIADGVAALKVMHDEVMRLCRSAREQALQDVGDFNQGRQAVNAYSANSG